jgi:hypothetical protein
VGVVVRDLEVTAQFFVDLGFIAKAHAARYHTVGKVVDYQGLYRLAYIRGSEGLIVEVAELLRSASTNP